MARIERVLNDGLEGDPPEVVRRKGHLGLVRTGGMAGVALGALGWIRSHLAAAAGAVATVAMVASAAVYLGSQDTRHDDPAASAPTQSVAPSITPPPSGPRWRPSALQPPAAPSRPGSPRALQPASAPPTGSTEDTHPVGPPLPTLPTLPALPALPTLPASPRPPAVTPSSTPVHHPVCVRTMLADRGRAEVCLTP